MADFAVFDYVTAEDIKEARKKLGITQKDFATLVGCSRPTVERWEKNHESITGPIALVTKMILENPDYFLSLMIPKQVFPLRLKYMHDNKLCSILDVDEIHHQVKVYHFTENRLMRAMGNNDTPSYDDYLEFLESRCFPKSRDKMKLILDDLGLPFYDPILIIEKTEGRMAEDNFWIKIER